MAKTVEAAEARREAEMAEAGRVDEVVEVRTVTEWDDEPLKQLGS